MKKIMMLMTLALVLLAGCTPSAQNGYTKEDVDAVVAAIKEAYGEDYGPSAAIPSEMLKEVYGIDMDNVEYFVAEGPEFSLSTDMLIVLLAKEGKVDALKADLEAYHDYLVNESFQYPMNMAKVQASQVVVEGNMLFLVVLGKYDDRSDISEAEALLFAQEQVQIAIDVIADKLD